MGSNKSFLNIINLVSEEEIEGCTELIKNVSFNNNTDDIYDNYEYFKDILQKVQNIDNSIFVCKADNMVFMILSIFSSIYISSHKCNIYFILISFLYLFSLIMYNIKIYNLNIYSYIEDIKMILKSLIKKK